MLPSDRSWHFSAPNLVVHLLYLASYCHVLEILLFIFFILLYCHVLSDIHSEHTRTDTHKLLPVSVPTSSCLRDFGMHFGNEVQHKLVFQSITSVMRRLG